MKEDLFLDDEIPFERQMKLPSESFFTPNSQKREQAKADARDTLAGVSKVILGDADADGLGAVAAIRAAYDETVPFVPCGPHGSNLYLGEALDLAADEVAEEATIIIQDVCIDETWKVNALPDVAEQASNLLWFDHHEWSDNVYDYVDGHTTYFEVDTETDNADADEYNARCTAQMVRDHFEEVGFTIPPHVSEAVDVTAEYDLWRKRDARCDDLNDYVSAAESYDAYVDALLAHGADILDDDTIADEVAIHREMKARRHEYAVNNATRTQIGGVTVAFVYGACPASVTNEVAETFRQQGVDLTVVISPGGGVSLRGSETFTDCHRIANQFDGGGHPKAAGCFPDLFDDMLDYADHWQSDGARVRQRVETALRKHTAEETTPTVTSD